MDDLTKDLTEVQSLDGPDGRFDAACISALKFIRTHHATIQQNAEDAKRLKALERAMDTYFGDCIGNVSAGGEWIRQRADEILREGEGL